MASRDQRPKEAKGANWPREEKGRRRPTPRAAKAGQTPEGHGRRQRPAKGQRLADSGQRPEAGCHRPRSRGQKGPRPEAQAQRQKPEAKGQKPTANGKAKGQRLEATHARAQGRHQRPKVRGHWPPPSSQRPTAMPARASRPRQMATAQVLKPRPGITEARWGQAPEPRRGARGQKPGGRPQSQSPREQRPEAARDGHRPPARACSHLRSRQP